MHGAAECRAHEHPQHAGQVAELRGEHRPDERAGTGDGGEVVAEDDPLVRLHVVLAVLVALGGRGAKFVECEDLGHEPRGVEAVADGEHADRGDDHPEGVDGFAARPREDGDGGGAERGDAGPKDRAQPSGQWGLLHGGIGVDAAIYTPRSRWKQKSQSPRVAAKRPALI